MTATGTEARVCQDIADRQAKGIAKYGTTVEGNPLGLLQWYKHHYEELLDAAVYVKRIIEVMEGAPIKVVHLPQAPADGERIFVDGPARVIVGPGMTIKQPKSTTLEDGSTLTATAGLAIGGGVFELWWADHMPNASQEEAWREWESVRNPVQAEPAEPHAELRKTWKPGQRWQLKGNAGWKDMQSSPTWQSCFQYRRHPDDQDPPAAEKPWIDWVGGDKGPSKPKCVQVRLRDGTIDDGSPDGYDWTHGGTAGDIVAYKVVK